MSTAHGTGRPPRGPRPEDGTETDGLSGLTARQVRAFLRDHPDFLARNPDLLREMNPPERFIGDGPDDNVVDLQAFMVAQARAEADRIRQTSAELIDTTRDNLSGQQRTHAAVLSVLEANTFEDLARIVQDDLPPILGIDVAILAFEPAGSRLAALYAADIALLSPGSVDSTIGSGRDVVLKPMAAGNPAIFRGAAGLVNSFAIARINWEPALPPGLIALGARHEGTFHPGQATDLLAFLASVLAVCVRKCLVRNR